MKNQIALLTFDDVGRNSKRRGLVFLILVRRRRNVVPMYEGIGGKHGVGRIRPSCMSQHLLPVDSFTDIALDQRARKSTE